MATISKAMRDAIAAAVAEAVAAVAVSKPVAATEASAHYKARDLPCAAAKPCSKTFRTVKGVAWHVANVSHA